jgi:ribosomal protein L21E
MLHHQYHGHTGKCRKTTGRLVSVPGAMVGLLISSLDLHLPQVLMSG